MTKNTEAQQKKKKKSMHLFNHKLKTSTRPPSSLKIKGYLLIKWLSIRFGLFTIIYAAVACFDWSLLKQMAVIVCAYDCGLTYNSFFLISIAYFINILLKVFTVHISFDKKKSLNISDVLFSEILCNFELMMLLRVRFH